MRKVLLFAIPIVLVLVGAFVILRPEKASTPSTPTATTTTQSSPSPTPTSSASGKYIDYSTNVIADNKGTKILFFHAPWCPQCRALDKSISEGQVPENVVLIKTDYDSNQALRKKYGVTIQTTLVRVDNNGELVKKYVAYDEPTLEAIKKNLL